MTNHFPVLTLVAAAAIALSAGAPELAGAATAERLTLSHDGVERGYLRYRPDRLAGARGAPLLLVLHGGRGTARRMMRYAGFNRLADREGFVAVYPDGLGRHWSDGLAVTEGADDVGFLLALIARESARPGVDPRRVFVAGISNGGFMALRMACDAAARLAGVAAVAAQFTEYLSTRCRPSGPVPVLLINGTEDPLVPFEGGVVAHRFGGRGRVISTVATLGFWAWRNGCVGEPEKRRLPDGTPKDGSRIEVWGWKDCAGRGAVRLYRIAGGGHTWPGKAQYLPKRWIGPTNRDADGSALIWSFFVEQSPSE